MKEANMVTQTAPDREEETARLREAADLALESARGIGVDACEISASAQTGLSVNVRLGEVETLEHQRDRGVGITVFLGKSKGHASSADLRPEAIGLCVQRAYDIARFTQADKCNGLADPDRMAREFPDLDLWHPETMDVAQAIERALACEEAGRADAGITNSEGASFSTSAGVSVYANSNGFEGVSAGTRYDQSCVLVAGKGEKMQRDYAWDSRRCTRDLESPEVTGRRAAERTIRRLDARQVPTCEAPVLFAPEVARGLIGHLVGAVSGSALYRNASFLKDAAGEALFPGWLSLRELPHLVRGAGSSVFDAEGVATAERDLVHAGVLTGYVLSSYSARRLGLATTGNAGGVHNLRVQGPVQPVDRMVGDMRRGLMVTEVMGQGVSIITGDYSRGAAGFWIEDGAVAYPVEEVTIAGNLRDMFRRVAALGDDLDDRGNIQAGSILVDAMTIAGS